MNEELESSEESENVLLADKSVSLGAFMVDIGIEIPLSDTESDSELDKDVLAGVSTLESVEMRL